MQRGVSSTQETTLSGIRTEKTARQAKERGYHIRLYYIGINTPEECVKRVQNRVAKGGHDISRCDVERRFAGRFDALKKILPYCGEAALFDNDNGFAEVAEYRNGALIAKGDYSPAWLEELFINISLSHENP